MKALILNLIIWIVSLAFSGENPWEKSQMELVWNSIPHKMTFRDPVVFTPLEIKAGYLYYGGKNYWFGIPYNNASPTIIDSPVLLDSTQYEFNIIDNFTNRQGFFIELDFLRTNLPHFIIYQNYIDFQFGMGLQFTDFFSDLTLPSKSGNEWNATSSRGEYYFHPRSIGLNVNSSLGWQLSRSNITYLYHSLGINSLSLYESLGGDRSLKGTGLSESFGIGTKYIFTEKNKNYNYTLGIEIKWNRLFMESVNVPKDLSPINGIDIRSSGIFLTSGIQFGGKHTDGDIAYAFMMQNDFISAAEYFKSFLANKIRHNKRKKAAELLNYCIYQIPHQYVKNGVEAISFEDYDQAIYWFDLAERNADEELKEELQANLQNIALALLDSVENHKNEMTIVNAKKLTMLSGELYPESKQYPQVMAGLYIDKAILNTEIGNYSGAVDNYQKALLLYPDMEYNIMEKLHNIANSLMKDAYIAFQEHELYIVLKSMKDIIKLQPKIAQDLAPYIIKLETLIENIHNEKMTKYLQQYIIDKKQESFNLTKPVLQLGITEKETEMILGKPKYIDQHLENKQQFKLWTYTKDTDSYYLYFRNNMLIRIDK